MSNPSPSLTPERILEFVWAFKPPLAIVAAIRHRVFDVLAKQPMSIAELAQAAGASTRGLSAIADLLVRFALLAGLTNPRLLPDPGPSPLILATRG
jgi:hypothetical protein